MECVENNKIEIIYLLGSGHCGSTLLDLMAGSHSRIVGVGELCQYRPDFDYLKNIMCTCRKPVSDCSFWSAVFQGINVDRRLSVYRNKVNFLFGRKKFVSDDADKQPILMKNYLNIIEKIYENILTASGKKVVFDSSKNTDFAELLLMSEKSDVVFIHLVRNGKGVMYSYKRKYGGVVFPVFKWLLSNIKIEIFKMRNKSARIIFLRYEDFVKNPEKELVKILNEFQLDFEKDMLHFRNFEHHQIGGNRLRLGDREKIEEDKKWQSSLSWFDIFMFNLLAGWLNKIYGY